MPEPDNNVTNWRLNSLERDVSELQKIVNNLATKQDFNTITKKLEEAAAKRDDRLSDWRHTIVGGTVAGVLVGIFLMVVQVIAKQPLHVP